MGSTLINSPRKRNSLKDVAEQAGISIATVSRVINNKGHVSAALRARVMEVARTLNYQPNLQARSLRKQKSRSIGLLIPNLMNTYYTALADSISQLLINQGYQLLLSSTRDNPAIEQETLNKLIGHDVDGIIWVPTVGSLAQLQQLNNQNIPAVSIVRKVENNLIDTIVFDDQAGSQAAIHHLIQLGHQSIGFIGGDTRYSSNYDRWQGYLAALRQAGLPLDNDLVKLGEFRSAWGSIACDEVLRLPTPPSALFVSSNAVIHEVLKALRQHALRIPQDISLICFDDLGWFSYSDPPISAVSTSHEMMAQAAVDLLQRRIEQPEQAQRPPVFMQLTFQLVIRHSTAPPNKNYPERRN